MSIRMAGDHDAINAANQNFIQVFKAPDLFRSLPVFLGIILAMSVFGQCWYVLVFWLLPFLTWFQLILWIRNIAEHGATEKSEDPLRNVRTTYAGPLMHLFLAPYWGTIIWSII